MPRAIDPAARGRSTRFRGPRLRLAMTIPAGSDGESLEPPGSLYAASAVRPYLRIGAAPKPVDAPLNAFVNSTASSEVSEMWDVVRVAASSHSGVSSPPRRGPSQDVLALTIEHTCNQSGSGGYCRLRCRSLRKLPGSTRFSQPSGCGTCRRSGVRDRSWCERERRHVPRCAPGVRMAKQEPSPKTSITPSNFPSGSFGISSSSSGGLPSNRRLLVPWAKRFKKSDASASWGPCRSSSAASHRCHRREGHRQGTVSGVHAPPFQQPGAQVAFWVVVGLLVLGEYVMQVGSRLMRRRAPASTSWVYHSVKIVIAGSSYLPSESGST
jgi:hypothetical protein